VLHRRKASGGPGLLRRVPVGAAWLGLDQLLSMASNLVVTVALVRRDGEAALGAFAAVYAVFTVYLVLQRALVSEPTAAARRASGADDGRDLAVAASTSLVLTTSLAVSLVLAVVALAGAGALLPLAVCLPLLAVQDNARYLSSRLSRPWWAAAMDGAWLVALVVLLVAVPPATGSGIVWLWALCGAGSVLLGAPLLRGTFSARVGPARAMGWWRRECADVGRATGFDMVLSQVYAQGTVLIVVAALGLGAGGQYRAAQSLFGGCLAVTVALNMYVLPHQRERGSSLRRVLWLGSRYAIGVGAVGAVTLLLSDPVQRLVFGRVVVGAQLALATFVLFVVLGLNGALSVALRVDAARRLGLLLGARAVMLLVGLPVLALVARSGSVVAVVFAQAAGVAGFLLLCCAGLAARPTRTATPGAARPSRRRRLSPFAVHTVAADTAGLDALYCRVRGLSGLRPDARTDLVVEGFPRSANTFVKASVLDANPAARVASHLHVARSVRRAVRLGIPAVVLVRDPADAVASLMVRDPRVHPVTALKAYLRFHRGVLPVLDGVVVVRFNDAVHDPAATVAAVDARYGRRFAAPPTDAAVAERVRAEVERMERDFAGGVLDERAVARPSTARADLAAAVRAELERSPYVELLARCSAVHDEVLTRVEAVGVA
jgi:O-antigen/teichoic acid export membrane protein